MWRKTQLQQQWKTLVLIISLFKMSFFYETVLQPAQLLRRCTYMKFPNLRPTPQTTTGHHPVQVAHLQSDCRRSSRFKKDFLRLCVYKPLSIKLTDASPVFAARYVMQARSDTPTLFLCACEVTTLVTTVCVWIYLASVQILSWYCYSRGVVTQSRRW